MSRIRLPINRKNWPDLSEFIVGLDKPLQHWFYQVWGAPPDDPEEDHLPLNENSLTGCSKNQLLEAIELYADPKDDYVQAVAVCVALDLDPGEHIGRFYKGGPR